MVNRAEQGLVQRRKAAGTRLATAGARPLAANLRRLRRDAGLTLDALAERSGVSRAMISKIERGISVPTATVLGKLAAALGQGLSHLVGTPLRRRPRLLPRAEQAVFRDPQTGFERRSLSPLFADGAVDLAFNTLPPRRAAVFPAHHAGMEEYLVVERGALVVVLDGTRHALTEGDTLFFPSDCPHEFRNETTRPAAFLVVVDDRAKR